MFSDRLSDIERRSLVRYVLAIILLTSSLLTGRSVQAAPGDEYWGAFVTPYQTCMDSTVMALAEYEGYGVAGGYFQTACGVTVDYVALFNDNAWIPLGAGFNDEVLALAADDSLLYAAGEFTQTGAYDANHVAVWDGDFWEALGQGLDGTVYALAIYDGDLIAAGDFETSGEDSAKYVARWNGSTWESLGSGYHDPSRWEGARSLLSFNGNLYVGYSDYGGVHPDYCIGQWNGSSWSDVAEEGLDGTVWALAAHDGYLYAGGDFTQSGDNVLNGVARFDGAEWVPLAGGMSHTSDVPVVKALASCEGALFAGGWFDQADTTVVNSIARWDGSEWSAIGAGMGLYGRAEAFLVVDQFLAVGGDFVYEGGGDPEYVRHWNGSRWTSVASGMDGRYVSTLYGFEGALFAGGDFEVINATAVGCISEYEEDGWGSLDEGIDRPTGYELVLTMREYNHELVVGGWFNSVSGMPASHIARWTDHDWDTLGMGTNAAVSALETTDVDLIAGGEFTEAGGVAANHIARWDGASWHPLQSGVDNTVLAIKPFESTLVVGGEFQTAGGLAAPYVAQWNGSDWSTMGDGFDSSVYVLLEEDTLLYAGGEFTMSGDSAVSHVARWDGSAWQPLGAGVNGAVCAMTMLDNRYLFVGGTFDSAGGIAANNVAVWNGSSWQALGSGTNDGVYAMIDGGGGVLCAGTFTEAGNQPARLAFWGGPMSCCEVMGNLDGSADNLVTMGDMVRLIDHLFRTLEPLDCMEEGNMDQSEDNLVTMGDLVVMIDHLFITLNPLPPCP